MKRLAAVIISIVFIFTACSRHALENKVFKPAERKQSKEQQKGAEQEYKWTMEDFVPASIFISVIIITAGILYYNNCWDKETVQEEINPPGIKQQQALGVKTGVKNEEGSHEPILNEGEQTEEKTYTINLQINSGMSNNEIITGIYNLDGVKDCRRGAIMAKIDFKIESNNADPINCYFKIKSIGYSHLYLYINIAAEPEREERYENRIGLIYVDSSAFAPSLTKGNITLDLPTKLGESPRITLDPDNEFIRDLIQIVPPPTEVQEAPAASDSD
jgi:hypothetical protein